MVGLLGLVAAVLMPFAPVLDHDTTVTWPQAGRDATSTTAFFVFLCGPLAPRPELGHVDTEPSPGVR